MKLKRRRLKKSKPNPNANFVSPLLRQDDESVVNNQNVAFNFPTTPKQADNSKRGNNQNSGLFREKTNKGVTLPHSLLVQPESEFTVSSSKMSFNFTSTTRTSKSSKEIKAVIPAKGQKVLPHISARPINELLEVPSEPLCGSSKKQKKADDTVIEKSLSELQVQSQSTNDQINVSTVEIKVESNLVKNEPKIIDSESSSSDSSSEDEDVELSKVSSVENNVIVLEDSSSEDETDEQADEILLDDSVVDEMNLSQELDVRFQSKKVLLNNCQNQIYVGNLPSSIKKLHVSKFFERYGNITDLKFIRSKVKKTTICFITYKNPSSVNSSLEANGLLYCGHNFHVARVGRIPVIVDCTVVVFNLPDDTTNQNLYDLFEVCGLIKSQYLVKTNNKLLAYITFELKISATYAVLLDNFRLKGCQIHVHHYTNKRENRGLSNKIT